jgi:hypothetical protein
LILNIQQTNHSSYSFALENTASTHTGTNAHADETSLLTSALKLTEKGNNHAGTSHTEGMAKSDGSTTRVELLLGYAKLFDAVAGLGGKSLIDLKLINLFHRKSCLFKSSRDCKSWSNTHNLGRDASDGERKNAAVDLAAEFDSDVTAAQKNASSAISDLAGVSGSSSSTLLESRLKFSETLNSGLGPATIIVVN